MWGREHKATLKKRDGETVHSKHTHSVSSTGQLHIWETEEKIEKSVFEYIDNWFNWYDWCMWWMARGEEKRECMNMRVSVSAVAPLLPARPSGTSDGGKPTQQSGPGGAACWVFPPPTLLARVNMIGQDWTTFWRRSTFANSGWGQATPPAPQRHQLLWISQERGCRTNKTAEEEQEKILKSERPSSRQIRLGLSREAIEVNMTEGELVGQQWDEMSLTAENWSDERGVRREVAKGEIFGRLSASWWETNSKTFGRLVRNKFRLIGRKYLAQTCSTQSTGIGLKAGFLWKKCTGGHWAQVAGHWHRIQPGESLPKASSFP